MKNFTQNAAVVGRPIWPCAPSLPARAPALAVPGHTDALLASEAGIQTGFAAAEFAAGTPLEKDEGYLFIINYLMYIPVLCLCLCCTVPSLIVPNRLKYSTVGK